MVRRANRNDIRGIISLLHQVNMVHHELRPDLFKANTTKYNEQELETLLGDESKPVFVYTDDEGSVVGHAFCQLTEVKDHGLLQDAKTLYIDDICVDENARGQHVGQAIYRHILDYARKLGCYNVTLNVWTCNPGAMKFYEKMGLTPYKVGMEQIL